MVFFVNQSFPTFKCIFSLIEAGIFDFWRIYIKSNLKFGSAWKSEGFKHYQEIRLALIIFVNVQALI